MIRHDYMHLARLRKFYGRKVRDEWASLPLVHLTAEQCKTFNDQNKNNIQEDRLYMFLNEVLPFNDFAFLFQNVVTDYDDYETDPYLGDFYGRYSVKRDNKETLIFKVTTFYACRVLHLLETHAPIDDTELDFAHYVINKNHKKIKAKDMEGWNYEMDAVFKNCSAIAFNLFDYIASIDQYPVEVTATKKPKAKGKNNAWKANLGPRIIFLDRLPTVTAPHQGGTHASPRGHQRRGHFKTLRHEKYKHHPLYRVENAIKVKPAWVGPEVENYQGNTYKLIKTPDSQAKREAEQR